MKKFAYMPRAQYDLSGVSIAFDLDGTLVDTAPDLVRVTNEVIATRGHKAVNYKLARAQVGYGSRRMIETALRAANDTISKSCLLYTSPSPRDLSTSRMPSSA